MLLPAINSLKISWDTIILSHLFQGTEKKKRWEQRKGKIQRQPGQQQVQYEVRLRRLGATCSAQPLAPRLPTPAECRDRATIGPATRQRQPRHSQHPQESRHLPAPSQRTHRGLSLPPLTPFCRATCVQMDQRKIMPFVFGFFLPKQSMAQKSQ